MEYFTNLAQYASNEGYALVTDPESLPYVVIAAVVSYFLYGKAKAKVSSLSTKNLMGFGGIGSLITGPVVLGASLASDPGGLSPLMGGVVGLSVALLPVGLVLCMFAGLRHCMDRFNESLND